MTETKQLSIFDFDRFLQSGNIPNLFSNNLNSNRLPSAKDLKKAENLLKLADKLQSQIDNKLNPAIGQQRPTRRRASIAASMYEDGQRLLQIQSWLRAIAKQLKEGSLPGVLKDIGSKTQLEVLLNFSKFPLKDTRIERILEDREYDSTKKLLRANLNTVFRIRQAIEALESLSDYKPEDPAIRKLKDLERGLIGVKIAGYFPTPAHICEQLIDLADLEDGMVLLEPSAGKGSICEAIKEKARVNLEVCEINFSLREILALKGFNLVAFDFVEEISKPKYDRIIMNPPFSQKQDIRHIRHAYDCLAPGGRVVAIASESISFRKDRAYQDFRDWLEDKCSVNEALPQGSFLNSDRPTGVNTRILVLDKD